MIPFTVVLHWLVKDAEMEMPSLSSSQMEGDGEKRSVNPCHEEGIQTSLLSVKRRMGGKHDRHTGFQAMNHCERRGEGSSKHDCKCSARARQLVPYATWWLS